MPPDPKFNPARQNARVGPLKLPASGRTGDPPPWPLETTEPAERALWAQLWATPQAVAWEQLGWVRVVARYARILRAAEELHTAAMAEARQLEDRLGLTPRAMRTLLWTITEDEVAERRDERTATDVRARIRSVS